MSSRSRRSGLVSNERPLYEQRDGVRGGRSQFNWDDVKNDKYRHNYLGNSVHASVGRWQEGRDIFWYAREANPAMTEQEKADHRKAEQELVRQQELAMMNQALGLGGLGAVGKPDHQLSSLSAVQELASREEQSSSRTHERLDVKKSKEPSSSSQRTKRRESRSRSREQKRRHASRSPVSRRRSSRSRSGQRHDRRRRSRSRSDAYARDRYRDRYDRNVRDDRNERDDRDVRDRDRRHRHRSPSPVSRSRMKSPHSRHRNASPGGYRHHKE